MPDNRKEPVLVTGANGFVGSRLCRRLLDDGYHVVAGIRENCNRELIAGLDLEYRYGDITCPETLPAMVKGIDNVIHNAGLVKAKDKEAFFRVNHFGARNIAEAAKNGDTKKFILISSTAAVGPSEPGQVLTENSPPRPITMYGRSKLAGEEAVLELKEELNSVIIRPSGVYGPGDKEMLAFFQIMNFRIKPYLGKLKRKIQLVHVDDLCLGVSKALKAVTKSGSVYFIAESRSYSFKELVLALRNAIGRKAVPVYIPASPLKVIARISEGFMKAVGVPPMFTLEKANEILSNWEISTAKAAEDLDFESQISFAEGARQTAEWYRREGWL